MRKPYPSYSLITLGGLFLAGSCSIIAEVDRTKIPQETGGTTPEGGQGTGGTSGATGGTGDTGGTAGDTGGGGTSGTAGGGGEGGDSGGTAGDAGAGPGGAGMGGEGGTPGPACGDGTIDSGEQCDDGDPPANSDGCSATCMEEAGWDCVGTPSTCSAAMCGDRIRAGAEMCDDGNNNVCGTCNAACSVSTPGAAATGSISPGSAGILIDGDNFTLNDGTPPAVEFEFDELPGNDGVMTGRVGIDFDPTWTDPAMLQAAIVTAINGATGLTITATNGTAPTVTLTNDVPGIAGNQTSGDGVVAPGFAITAMTGGAAHDCAAGVGCNADADCLNGTCSTSAHTCN
jgi:cysteine-rich repeat protein